MVGIVTASANNAAPALEPSSAPTLKAVAVIAFEKLLLPVKHCLGYLQL